MVQTELLSSELLQAQLDNVDFLKAMYSGDQELSISQENSCHLEAIEEYLQSGPGDVICEFSDASVATRLRIPIQTQDGAISENLYLHITYLFTSDLQKPAEFPPAPRLSLERPAWLNRKEYADLVANLPNESDDLVSDSVEILRSTASDLLESRMQCSIDYDVQVGMCNVEIVRVWFYFPSLSTREKRNDLVNLAPAYDLTGFVLAGKPGVLCLEGSPNKIQSYIADIKRNSWGDIPSFQKKISERFREDSNIVRKFKDMGEITDDIERHGQRGNRGDLSQVEQFLKSAGLGEAFGRVFMQREG